MNQKRFLEIQELNARLCFEKNVEYGDRSLSRLGPAGLIPRIVDKTERLITRVWDRRGRKTGRTDSAWDAARDLANYAVILQMMIEGTFTREAEHGAKEQTNRSKRDRYHRG